MSIAHIARPVGPTRVPAGSRWVGGWAVGIAFFLLCATPASATFDFGPLSIFGSLETQNLFRMRQVGDFQPVQQRNTLLFGGELAIVESGRLAKGLSSDEVSIPWLDEVSLFGLYRGVYDSIYDIAPGGNLYDITGQPVGSIDDVSRAERRQLRFADNDLREFYLDVEFASIPLSLRIGRQQIVWGETDFFRLLDRINPLDLTWHLQQEIEVLNGWERLRMPLWMLKWNYSLPDLGSITDPYFEGFWNPGFWRPARRGFLPRYPWSLPLADPFSSIFPGGLASGTKLFVQGDYSRSVAENSQVGFRLAGYVAGFDVTVAYLWQRWAGDDGSNAASVSALLDPTAAQEAVAGGMLPAEFIAPYTHNLGFSASYLEEDYTDAIFRSEMLYIFGVPFQDGDKPSPIFPGQLFGASTRDMWQGMLSFERSTDIPLINDASPWLLLGQFFWHHVIHNSHAVGDKTGFVGNLSPTRPLVIRGTDETCTNPNVQSCEAVDKVRDWEALFTFTATSFYLDGKIAPQITYILDPVNKFNMMLFWTVDWFVTDSFTANIGQRYFINTTSQPVYESWGLAGTNRGRSETQLRLSYRF